MKEIRFGSANLRFSDLDKVVRQKILDALVPLRNISLMPQSIPETTSPNLEVLVLQIFWKRDPQIENLCICKEMEDMHDLLAGERGNVFELRWYEGNQLHILQLAKTSAAA